MSKLGRKPTHGEPTKPIGLTLPVSLIKRIDSLEGRENRTRSQVVTSLLATILEDGDFDHNAVSRLPFQEIIG